MPIRTRGAWANDKTAWAGCVATYTWRLGAQFGQVGIGKRCLCFKCLRSRNGGLAGVGRNAKWLRVGDFGIPRTAGGGLLDWHQHPPRHGQPLPEQLARLIRLSEECYRSRVFLLDAIAGAFACCAD